MTTEARRNPKTRPDGKTHGKGKPEYHHINSMNSEPKHPTPTKGLKMTDCRVT